VRSSVEFRESFNEYNDNYKLSSVGSPTAGGQHAHKPSLKFLKDFSCQVSQNIDILGEHCLSSNKGYSYTRGSAEGRREPSCGISTYHNNFDTLLSAAHQPSSSIVQTLDMPDISAAQPRELTSKSRSRSNKQLNRKCSK